MQMLGFDDNKSKFRLILEIGMFLLVLTAFLYMLGILLFFKKSLLLISNIMYLFGLYFFIGVTGTIKFFTKKGKIKGSIFYFSGLLLIIIGWSFFGSIIQLLGFFLIFRSFLPEFYQYICRIPFIGYYLKSYYIQNWLDKMAGNSQTRI